MVGEVRIVGLRKRNSSAVYIILGWQRLELCSVI